MKNIIKLCACVCVLLSLVAILNNYITYKRLQCVDHNTKGYILRFVPSDEYKFNQRRIEAKIDAIARSNYSLLYGCRIYENGKLTKFVYEYPMTDEAFSKDYTQIIETVNEYKNSHK